MPIKSTVEFIQLLVVERPIYGTGQHSR